MIVPVFILLWPINSNCPIRNNSSPPTFIIQPGELYSFPEQLAPQIYSQVNKSKTKEKRFSGLRQVYNPPPEYDNEPPLPPDLPPDIPPRVRGDRDRDREREEGDRQRQRQIERGGR